MKGIGCVAGVSLLLLGASAPALAQSQPWIHVQVEEARGARVHVNVPLSLVEVALRAAPERILDEDRIRIGRHGRSLKVSDMRRLWGELKAAGETDFVRVDDERDGESITVSRKADLVQVRVDGARRGEKVMVDVPVALVDALLAGEGEEFDVKGAVSELSKMRGDIVRVQDEKDTVRVWIDEGN
jgi:hypothetical protein